MLLSETEMNKFRPGMAPVRALPRKTSRLLSFVLATTVLTVAPVLRPLYAQTALPDGASVAAGRVSIDRDGNRMTVRQGSDRGIVNWNGFSIGEGASVDFRLPDRDSAILNRVTGNTSSTIAGALTGNGQVFLINPNGIAIT